MSIKTVPQVFHGLNDIGDNYDKFYFINTSTDGSATDKVTSQGNLQSTIDSSITINDHIQQVPLRFKLADNDESDISNPIPIPDDGEGQNFSYWKQFKLQVGQNVNNENGYLSNLRFYCDTNSWQSGLEIHIGYSPTYHQQEDTTTHTDFFQFSVSDTDFQDKGSLLNYDSNNPITLVDQIFYYKSAQNTDSQVTVGGVQVDGYTTTDVDKNLFGTLQPYVYLQISVDSTQMPGNTSQIGIFYRYDEV